MYARIDKMGVFVEGKDRAKATAEYLDEVQSGNNDTQDGFPDVKNAVERNLERRKQASTLPEIEEGPITLDE